jgi:hypothetical protein
MSKVKLPNDIMSNNTMSNDIMSNDQITSEHKLIANMSKANLSSDKMSKFEHFLFYNPTVGKITLHLQYIRVVYMCYRSRYIGS